MEFRLTYSGPLKSAAGIKEKHQLRYAFHNQFKVLWNQLPLNERSELLENPPKRKGDICIVRELDGFNFAPLVCERLHLICELNILLLRPEAPGSVITQGGDIDNRLKTLFDSLRMPRHKNELPKSLSPSDVDDPLYCLLEDDNLITKVNVTTDRLLQKKPGQNEVMLIIHVTTKAVKAIWGNMGLG